MFVYELYNVDNELLYVGVTNNLPKRLGEHKRLSPWWSEVFSPLTVIYECSTRREALLKEYEAIDSKSPKYNKVNYKPKSYVNEDNSFSYIDMQRIEFTAMYGGKFTAKDRALYREKIEALLEENGIPREYLFIRASLGSVHATYALHKDIFTDLFINKLKLKELSESYHRGISYFSWIYNGKRLRKAVEAWRRYNKIDIVFPWE